MRKSKSIGKTIVESIERYVVSKNIDKATVGGMLHKVFSAMVKKEYGTMENFSIVVNSEEGDIQIFRSKLIVADEDYTGREDQIPLSEAQKIEQDFEIGEEVDQEVPLEAFKLRSQQLALGQLKQLVQDIERSKIYEKYKRVIGEIIDVEVHYKNPNYIIVRDEEKNDSLIQTTKKMPQPAFFWVCNALGNFKI